ncbi:S9 family peptidase [Leekyejoonella antrihumi]|uniref:S9 family peptidase n=1 Tax=Leekyejoonella antrihumi TaxID=1660198 RepID=A0A563E0C0_9MICO|nr:S9 family peptidase [Leekyejoonella antrihumi]TWP35835.1 S9 family peptidase [Leekyejoonella antrihumi]
MGANGVTTAPFGTWRSPLTAAALAQSSLSLSEPATDGDDVYWLEGRPSEGGRTVLVRHRGGGRADVTPAPFDVRSRVHEYGGGGYAVRDGVVVFVNFTDQRIYRLAAADDAPQAITAAGSMRYGGLHLDLGRRCVYAVREDHGGTGEPVNTLVRVSLDAADQRGTVVVEGSDFVSHPGVSPDGRRLTWVQWDHPNMPWDDTRVCIGVLDDMGDVIATRVAAAGSHESVDEPRWAPDGRLVWLSDRSGFANLYAEDLTSGEITCLLPRDLDFGVPGWSLGTSTFGFTEGGDIICSWLEDGFGHLGVLDAAHGTVRELDAGATAYRSVAVGGRRVVCVASFADKPSAVITLSADADRAEPLQSASRQETDPGYVSRPEPVQWHNESGQEVYGFYYPPVNPEFTAPAGERPPLLVMSHGGPTSRTAPVLTAATQYWTTRGFAVLDVNYGGSTGYGRAYRERLKGSWGVTDVDDCASGALAMADQGRADRHRLAIRGGSAGGFTTLAALTFTDVFAAGASHFGISDLTTLAKDTHKFESRYGDGLVGPYPQAAQLYEQRSPINHIDQLSSPMILLQGTEDKVVPPSQAMAMADALKAKGIPVRLVLFEGEGHGFRKAENIIAALESEEQFYAEVLLDPA